MIELISKINLANETKDIIVCYNPESGEFNELNGLLNHGLTDLNETLTIPTLKLLKANKVHLFKQNKIEEAFKTISQLKGDYLVLLDTFKDKSTSIYRLFGEIIKAENDQFNLKSKKEENKKNFYVYSKEDVKSLITTGEVIGESIAWAKQLIAMPNNYLNADKMAKMISEKIKDYKNVKVDILTKADLERLKMGAFLAVNQGSYDEPRLIAINIKVKDDTNEPICFVGKGLTFDTGGYSLKSNMVGMKSDMSGGAAVLATALAVARLQVPGNYLFLVGATDNRMGEKAIVPDDIITSMSGKTIEIVSTDAEGRLVLADVLTYAQSINAKKIIDIATLTGSMSNTFGGTYTGAYTNDQTFYDQFKKAADKVEESLWQMPLDSRFFELIKSPVADMKNSSGKPTSGASSAAIFLKEFINEDTKWIHLDIAGTAMKNELPTGVMVKSFIEFCLDSKKSS